MRRNDPSNFAVHPKISRRIEELIYTPDQKEQEMLLKTLTPLEAKYIQMYGFWKRMNLMPWQWGLTREPCIEHIKAIEAIDIMVEDMERMKREMKGMK